MNSHGPVVGGAARLSSFWTDFETLTMNAREWYGMDESFEDISFNVQGTQNGTDFEALHKNNKNRLWIAWSTNLKRIDPLNPTRPSKDVPYEFRDGRARSTIFVHMTHEDVEVVPKQDHDHQLSHRRQPVVEPVPSTHRSNVSATNPPTPVMFSADSRSADEDEQLMTSTNEWTYPNVKLAGRQMKVFKRKHFEKSNREVVIILCVNDGPSEDPCGAYDESFIPTANAINLVTEWEILHCRTTVYLCARADGIVSSKVLQKYIGKKNSDWVKLYRYLWLESQAIHLGVFVSPKTFAVATCTDHAADEDIRRAVVRGTVLPPAQTSWKLPHNQKRRNDHHYGHSNEVEVELWH